MNIYEKVNILWNDHKNIKERIEKLESQVKPMIEETFPAIDKLLALFSSILISKEDKPTIDPHEHTWLSDGGCARIMCNEKKPKDSELHPAPLNYKMFDKYEKEIERLKSKLKDSETMVALGHAVEKELENKIESLKNGNEAYKNELASLNGLDKEWEKRCADKDHKIDLQKGDIHRLKAEQIDLKNLKDSYFTENKNQKEQLKQAREFLKDWTDPAEGDPVYFWDEHKEMTKILEEKT